MKIIKPVVWILLGVIALSSLASVAAEVLLGIEDATSPAPVPEITYQHHHKAKGP